MFAGWHRERRPGLRLRQLRDPGRERQIVLVLRYFPEDAERKRKASGRYADLRYKAMAARQHGAKAVMVVAGALANAGELVR